MKPLAPPDKAFVKAHSFDLAIKEFRDATNLSVQDGTVQTLTDGARTIHFNRRRSVPFGASGSQTSITVDDGFASFAGRHYYFPKATYNGIGPGGVFLKVTTDYNVAPVYVGPDEYPWECVIDDSVQPALVWRTIGTTGTHPVIRNPPDDPPDVPPTGDFTLVIDGPGTIYIPIAGWSGVGVVNYIRENLCLFPAGTGAVEYNLRWS